jgi:tripartite-type tricarboxylate transporter receptor subunit TctC
MIVPSAIGGSPDIITRIIAPKLSEALGQPMIVENRPGAGGAPAMAAVATSPSDGYTLVFGTPGALIIASRLMANPGYEPGSFAPISLLITAPFVMVGHSSVPANSLKEVIELARSKPGQLNFGTSAGTLPHLTGFVFMAAAGVNITPVTYKSISQAYVDLSSNTVQIMFEQVALFEQGIRSGRIKAFAVASSKRHPKLPDVPTAAEAGLPGFEVLSWGGLLAPRGTPVAIVKRLNAGVQTALQAKEIQEALLKLGVEPVGSSPEQYSAFIESETVKWTRAVKASGARVD